MILQELFALAQREKLLEDTAFQERPIHFVVRIDAEGNYVGLDSWLDDRLKPRKVLAPKAAERTVASRPSFLVDNAQYTLRMAKDGKAKNAQERAADFDALIVEAAEATRDAGLTAVRRFLERRDEFMDRIRADAPTRTGKKGEATKPWDWNADEVIAFALRGDVERVDERPGVEAWWRSRRAASQAPKGELARCLVTGELLVPTTDAHSKIKGVPEGNTSGTALISCNAPAFETHGREDTAPISHAGADAYVRAINWLLEREGERCFRQGVLLDGGSVVVFWTREKNSVIDALLDLGGLFGGPDADPAEEVPTAKKRKVTTTTAEDARRTLESPWRGLEHESTDPTALFALTLSANAARVVVRDWLTSTAGEIKDHLRAWFIDLSIVGRDVRPLPLRQLLMALQARPDAKDKLELPPDLALRLFRCAVQGTALPRTIVARAVQRFRIVDDPRRPSLLQYRAALLKAAFNRQNRATPGWKEITVALDETNTEPGYVLGRLFALLEQLQLKASGRGNDLNATVRDRYFGAASSTPAVVFPRLLALSVHHASKVAKEGDTWVEREKGAVMNLLGAHRFPRTLDLDQQGLFAIGYYHQREARFRPRGGGKDGGGKDGGTTAGEGAKE